MPLQTFNDTSLSPKDAADELRITRGSFYNLRTAHGDSFLMAHTDLIPGRTFFRASDVHRVARERGE